VDSALGTFSLDKQLENYCMLQTGIYQDHTSC